jgi:hypothetical protein
MFHKLKFHLSEPYRIRTGCGLSAIRNKREAKALYQFAERS